MKVESPFVLPVFLHFLCIFLTVLLSADSSWTWHQNARGSIYTRCGKGCHSWPLSQNGQPITVGACGALGQGCVRASLQASPLGGCGGKTAPTTPGGYF
uniref:Putative secreted protein n=1 Tax=Ixodes scapularis TaxID=6945 RepID=A0A4D5S151_IXOSC